MNKIVEIVEIVVLAIGFVVSGIFALVSAFGLLGVLLSKSETIFHQIYVQVCVCSALLFFLIAAVVFSTCVLLIKMGLGKATIKGIIAKSPVTGRPMDGRQGVQPPPASGRQTDGKQGVQPPPPARS